MFVSWCYRVGSWVLHESHHSYPQNHLQSHNTSSSLLHHTFYHTAQLFAWVLSPTETRLRTGKHAGNAFRQPSYVAYNSIGGSLVELILIPFISVRTCTFLMHRVNQILLQSWKKLQTGMQAHSHCTQCMSCWNRFIFGIVRKWGWHFHLGYCLFYDFLDRLVPLLNVADNSMYVLKCMC